MKIESYRQPESSFLSVEKDLGILMDLFLRNERLKKLLYYTTPDALKRSKLTDEQTYSLFGKNFVIVPKRVINTEVLNQVVIQFDDFVTNGTNPEFRDNFIEFSILCNFDQWHLKDYELRPYKIAAEIDSMINNQKLTGIGTLQFVYAAAITYNDDFGGITLKYEAIHGGEDKRHMPNPVDDEQFIEDFDEMYND